MELLLKIAIIVFCICIFLLGYSAGALNEYYKSKKEVDILTNLINKD